MGLRKSAALLSFACALALAVMQPASALPRYANETGADCSFCHVGQPARRQFTHDGAEYLRYLESMAPPAAPPTQEEACLAFQTQCNAGDSFACTGLFLCVLNEAVGN